LAPPLAVQKQNIGLVIEIFLPSTAVTDRGQKRELYARSHVLDSSGYRLAARAAGTEAVDLPPFTGLGLVPASLWPEFLLRP
jgi:hypothetical protein